ncbi:MAG: hypothetical protein LBB51_05360 [Zoogloeaceae bacterium]|jgi:hypothetical protein|nr:hypothetical protein [Zoogloeaceae bacterium]
MLSWFSKKPKFVDREFSDLSFMLTQDEQDVTYLRDALDSSKLDFSLDSLRHIDEYLEKLRSAPPDGHDFLRVVLRTGAYVGEVMKRQCPGKYNWIAYDEAAKHSDFVKGLEHSIASTAMLWYDKGSVLFPLGKVCKYLENGSEDSVYFFAQVLSQPSDNSSKR